MTSNNIHHRGITLVAMLIMCCSFVFAKQYTVIIDAGHGGKDAGAVDCNVKEKDINLAVAIKLGKLIEKKIDDVDVIYTRDNDTYLTLQQRANIANESKGDLFISIHTNSVAKSNKNRRTVCGASTYTLGLHKGNDNMEVARRENSVMTLEKDYQTNYQGFNPNSDESYIIFELAQKENMSQSIRVANDIQKELTKVAGRQDRGVHQAGFWVLWATSMPSVLVELDFICNPISAKYLSSDKGQNKLALGIFNAVESHFDYLRMHHNNKSISSSNSDMVQVNDFSAQVEINTDNISDEIIRDNSAPDVSDKHNNGNVTKRRRRSQNSRQASVEQEYDVAIIKPKAQPYYTMQEGEEVNLDDIDVEEEKIDEEKLEKNSNEKEKQNNHLALNNDSNNRATKRVAKEETNKNVNQRQNSQSSKKTITPKNKSQHTKQVAQNSNSKKNRKSTKAKLNKKTTVYKVLIYTCDELLRRNDVRLCGLKNIKCKLKDGKYIYTYGESENKNDIDKILKKVKLKVPTAVIITDTKTVKY